MSERSLLLELGCEELPSSSLRLLGETLGAKLVEQLDQHGLQHGQYRWFATPRRLGVLIEAVAEQSPDETQEALGPPLAQAKDEDGNWTRAAQGFASRQGLAPEDLEVIETPKGPRLGLQRVVPGERTHEILLSLVNHAVGELPIGKRMRWGASRVEFARPVHWVVLLYGEQTDFGEVLGIASGRESAGHRFHTPDTFSVASPESYEAQLRSAKVIADFDERSAQIKEQVEAAARSIGGEAVIDSDLLEEVTSLVEWPVALAGNFDSEFLEVPAEALVSSMQKHQKYFPVVDRAGELMPCFITVSNIESTDPKQVVAGNERVIRPRLADAAFFYRQDLQRSLESRLEQLSSVVFQQRLGSVLDKTHRVQRLAGALAQRLNADVTAAERAALLCKADLVSEMVLEFADMQGIAGTYYARNDGETPEVADAIAQHYWPTQSKGVLPQSPTARCVALADRLDTLTGIFGIGQPPTGSKDPFALRRASIAVLRILIEESLDLDLRDCLELAKAGFDETVLGDDTVNAVFSYMIDRFPALYDDTPIEVFRAVRATGCSNPLDFDRRVRAVEGFFRQPDAEALAAANKRVGNILAKAEDHHGKLEVSDNLLQETEEIELYSVIQSIALDNQQRLRDADYHAALTGLAALRSPVDRFFDQVMVNADDPALKTNRLALLARLRSEFLAVADISQLAG